MSHSNYSKTNTLYLFSWTFSFFNHRKDCPKPSIAIDQRLSWPWPYNIQLLSNWLVKNPVMHWHIKNRSEPRSPDAWLGCSWMQVTTLPPGLLLCNVTHKRTRFHWKTTVPPGGQIALFPVSQNVISCYLRLSVYIFSIYDILETSSKSNTFISCVAV